MAAHDLRRAGECLQEDADFTLFGYWQHQKVISQHLLAGTVLASNIDLFWNRDSQMSRETHAWEGTVLNLPEIQYLS
jgi:hypothetical protein